MTIHPLHGAGPISATVGVSTALLTKLVSMTPELQALSLLVSICAGLFSIVWYVRKFFRDK